MKTIINTKFLRCMLLAGILNIGYLCAQETPPPPASGTAPESGPSFEIGARYMPTFSSFKLRQPDGSSLVADYEVGHGFGAVTAYNFSGVVGLQAELMYSQLAQKYKYQGVDRSVNLDYVNIPLLLSLNTGKYRAINLNVVAGPQLGINVGGKSTDMGTGTEGQDSLRTVVSAKASDIGFAYGAGLDFGLGAAHRTRLGIGFRGVYGLIDISKDNNNQVSSDYYILDRTHVETYAAYIGLSYLIK